MSDSRKSGLHSAIVHLQASKTLATHLDVGNDSLVDHPYEQAVKRSNTYHNPKAHCLNLE